MGGKKQKEKQEEKEEGKEMEKKERGIVLTQEQQAIMAAEGNLRINAVAGSGKTTTIIEFARTRPKGTRILYLAFNKSVRLEAARKFSEQGLANVTVETAHSLAYRYVFAASGYRVRAAGYKTHEIAAILGLPSGGEKHGEYVIANHINKFILFFCNSEALKVQELNYLDAVPEGKAKKFVTAFYKTIEEGTRIFLGKMDRGDIEVTHDFYLKKFQLSRPRLPYDYILFDEGQDASAAMLSVFLSQPANCLIVGDAHQQIYSWRFAVNSLERASFPQFHLSVSFRFSQTIANLAMEVLGWKSKLGDYVPVTITGAGGGRSGAPRAIIARTNLGLLLRAIEYISDHPGKGAIYFEGNISSYTYADEGASLYDVLNLYNGKHDSVRDKLLSGMKDVSELEEFIEKTEDAQLGMMLEIVEKYGNEIYDIIKTLKEKHAANEDKGKADMIFSTVHRCKGMEYASIELVNDFISESKLEKALAEAKEKGLEKARLNEEINLLYVAITRTAGTLRIPESILPKGFSPSPEIVVLKPKAKEALREEKAPALPPVLQRKLRRITHAEKEFIEGGKRGIVRGHKTGANKKWNAEQDRELLQLYADRVLVAKIAKHFGRTEDAILSRLRTLNYEV